MKFTLSETILYVADQQKSCVFYKQLFAQEPVLDVPGMTEFELAPGIKLGLMPENGIARILDQALPHPSSGNGVPRCELYLMCDDPALAYNHAIACGAKSVSVVQNRDWGHQVAYVSDADGHVLAFAKTL
jgi:lactoylglutathione lyase